MRAGRLSGKEIRASFDCANVYIGALVGPQLVAGTYAVFYYLQAGAWSMLLPFLGVGIIGMLCYFGAEVARHYKVYEYGAFARKMYNNNAILCTIFDFFILGTLVVGEGAYLAMAGTFWTQLLHQPGIVGMIIISVIAIVLTSFSDALVRVAGSVMTIIMLVGFIVVLVLIGVLYHDRLAEVIGNWFVPATASAAVAIKNFCIFGFASCTMSVTLCCVEQPIKKKAQSIWIMIFTTVIGGVMMSLSCLSLLPFFDDVMKVEVPLIYIMDNMLKQYVPWLPVMFYIVMLVAVISSTVPSIFMATTRLVTLIKKEKYEKNRSRYLMLMGCLFQLVAIGIASLGLSNILSYGFSIIAYFGIPLVCIPTCILLPRKFRKERQARLAVGLPAEAEPDD